MENSNVYPWETPRLNCSPNANCQTQLLSCNRIIIWARSLSHHRQVEAEAELRGWQGFRGWAQIRSHAETTDHSRKPVSALVCWWRRSGHQVEAGPIFSGHWIPYLFFRTSADIIGYSRCPDFSGHVRRPTQLPKLTRLLTSAISVAI